MFAILARVDMPSPRSLRKAIAQLSLHCCITIYPTRHEALRREGEKARSSKTKKGLAVLAMRCFHQWVSDSAQDMIRYLDSVHALPMHEPYGKSRL